MRGHDITEQPSRIRRAGLGGRRVPRGPWPARPGVVPVGVRPVQPAWPAFPPVVRRSSALGLLGASLLGVPRRAGQRVLARRAAVPPQPVVPWAQRVLVTAALAMATATTVVLLGLLAGAVSESRVAVSDSVSDSVSGPGSGPAVVQSGHSATVTVTVGAEETVWEVAESVVPSATGPELGALAERIVVDNALPSVRVQPGQVLRVTAG